MAMRQPPSPAVEPKNDTRAPHVLDADHGVELAGLLVDDALEHQQIALRLRRRCGARPDGRDRRASDVAFCTSAALRIGMRQHEAREAIGQASPCRCRAAADQPGMRHAPALIGVEQRLLGLGMAEQRVGLARQLGRRRSSSLTAPRLPAARASPAMQPLADDRPDALRHHVARRPRRRSRRCASARPRRARDRRVRRFSWNSSVSASKRSAAPLPRRRVGARQPDVRRHVEDEGEIGHGGADGDALQAADQLRVDLAERALIDAGRIDEAVADHPFAVERAPAG